LNFLQLTEISGNISIRKFRFHLSGFTLGDKIYKETVFKLSSEKSINDRLSAGVLLSNYHLKIQNYGSTNCVTLGVLVKTNIATGLEANLQIPSLISISKSSLFQEIPQIFSLSFLKLISKKQSINYSIVKDVLYNIDHQIYWRIEIFKLGGIRVGYKSLTNETAWGINIRSNKLLLGFGFVVHPVLGISHGFNLSYD